MTIRLEYNQFTTLYADNMYLKKSMIILVVISMYHIIMS